MSYRAEEESLVFEFGARHFSAGLAGENAPRCRLTFGPEDSRRVGDYRRWLPGFEERQVRKREGYEWGEDHELWRLDMRRVDLGLVEDKIERAVREAYTKFLLLDSKLRRVVLLTPSVMPHALLSCILTTLFVQFSNPTITLMPIPLVCMAAAGCRTALVVDIGWEETTVTGLYEYREVLQTRTTRAMKAVTQDMARLIHSHCLVPNPKVRFITEEDIFDDDMFEYAEEVTTRMAWCRSHDASLHTPTVSSQSTSQSIEDEVKFKVTITDRPINTEEDPIMSIPRPPPSHEYFQIPFSSFALPVENALYAPGSTTYDIDDNDQPLHLLTYQTLLRLAPDVRSLCMSRIIITGGGSHIPGLKTRLLEDLSTLVTIKKWNPVSGKAATEHRQRLNSKKKTPTTPPAPPTSSAPHPPEEDPIAIKSRREHPPPNTQPTIPISISGVVRGVETLGAWAGGSLLASLKIKSVVEIDRDVFLHQGIASARRDLETSVVASQRQGAVSVSVSGVARTGPRDPAVWTLGMWA